MPLLFCSGGNDKQLCLWKSPTPTSKPSLLGAIERKEEESRWFILFSLMLINSLFADLHCLLPISGQRLVTASNASYLCIEPFSFVNFVLQFPLSLTQTFAHVNQLYIISILLPSINCWHTTGNPSAAWSMFQVPTIQLSYPDWKVCRYTVCLWFVRRFYCCLAKRNFGTVKNFGIPRAVLWQSHLPLRRQSHADARWCIIPACLQSMR